MLLGISGIRGHEELGQVCGPHGFTPICQPGAGASRVLEAPKAFPAEHRHLAKWGDCLAHRGPSMETQDPWNGRPLSGSEAG